MEDIKNTRSYSQGFLLQYENFSDDDNLYTSLSFFLKDIDNKDIKLKSEAYSNLVNNIFAYNEKTQLLILNSLSECIINNSILPYIHDLLIKVSPAISSSLLAIFKGSLALYEEENQLNKRYDHQADVLLFVPNFLSASSFLQPPIEMLIAKRNLKKMGLTVHLIDNRVSKYSLDDLTVISKNFKYIVVTTSPYDHIQNFFIDYRLKYAFKSIDHLKHGNFDAKIYVCGAHGTVRPDIVFSECASDYVVKGEYDAVIDRVIAEPINLCTEQPDTLLSRSDLCRYSLNEENGTFGPFELCDLHPEAKTKHLSNSKTTADFEGIDFSKYFGDNYDEFTPTKVDGWGVSLATRGCASDCEFCFNFWGRRTRYRAAISVINELQEMQNLGCKELFFIDFHFTQNKRWVTDFCTLYLDFNLHIPWSAQARCDSVDNELIEIMSRANCKRLWFGVESLNTDQASKNKYKNTNHIESSLQLCSQYGIEPHMFIVMGLPGETYETIEDNANKIISSPHPFCGLMTATPRFGTEFYKKARKQYPKLGKSFYSLSCVKGEINNSVDIYKINEVINNVDEIKRYK